MYFLDRVYKTFIISTIVDYKGRHREEAGL